MIQYEVYISNGEKPFYTFYSPYQFQINEQLFIEKKQELHRMLIHKITHSIRGEVHIVRLNTSFKKTFE